MQWEQLTATDFAAAVEESERVCVVAFGVVEKHSEHLPLGTDYLNGHRIASLAAEQEPAVVFPPFYFGQIYEARCFPGTITIRPRVLMELVQDVFDEIGRNGFEKIIAFCAHGGNVQFLQFMAQVQLWEEKPYSVYVPPMGPLPEDREAWQALFKSEVYGHGGEMETGLSLVNHEALVKMDRVPEEPAFPLGRLEHLPPLFTAVNWYADYPDHYAGDARPVTREQAEDFHALAVKTLAAYIAAVKADDVVPGLHREFYNRVKGIGK
jgi:creatinine amidohydrolase